MVVGNINFAADGFVVTKSKSRGQGVRPRPSRREQASAERLRKVQHEKAISDRRRRTVTALAVIVIAGLAIAIVVAVVNSIRGDEVTASDGGRSAPANLSATGAMVIGNAKAPVTVEIYFDYMCPACGAFERANGDELTRLLAGGDAVLELRPISFLDGQSEGTRYSTRTANAVATVADGAPESVWDFHRALYAAQPQEGTSGLTDQEIADIAVETGVPRGVVDRFTDADFNGWVADSTQQSFSAGVETTPTVLINGEMFTGDPFTVGPLTEAIQSAGDAQS